MILDSRRQERTLLKIPIRPKTFGSTAKGHSLFFCVHCVICLVLEPNSEGFTAHSLIYFSISAPSSSLVQFVVVFVFLFFTSTSERSSGAKITHDDLLRILPAVAPCSAGPRLPEVCIAFIVELLLGQRAHCESDPGSGKTPRVGPVTVTASCCSLSCSRPLALLPVIATFLLWGTTCTAIVILRRWITSRSV